MWDAILDGGFAIIQFFYNFVHDWGMSIIIVTIIFRGILTPLVVRQAKSNFKMQKVQPQMQELQKRFANDQQRLGEEMRKLYSEAKFNPLAGCLPMLLQMPLFIIFFQVLRSMADRVGDSNYQFYGLVPDLVMSPSDAWAVGFGTFVPYVILLLIFALATFMPMMIQQIRHPNNGTNSQGRTTLIMGVVMTVIMLWIGWGSPAGVLLYWGTSSLLGIAQNQGTMAYMRHKDRVEEEETVDVRPVAVDVTRRVKKARPTKKGSGKKR